LAERQEVNQNRNQLRKMFNLIFFAIILVLQVMPMVLIDRIGVDLSWHVYQLSSLLVIFLQSFYIYIKQPFEKYCTKALALIILLLSAWFLYDYLAISFEVEEDVIIEKPGSPIYYER